MRQQLEEEDGMLVLFHSIDSRWYLPTESELAEQIPLQPVMRDDEGVMYRYDKDGG